MSRPRVRLFVEAPLAAGGRAALTERQARYVRRVMRLGAGAEIALFNGRDGEWTARVAPSGRRGCAAEAVARLRAQPPAAGPVLAFAPLRPARTELLAEKATELGARILRPVALRRARGARARAERLRAHAVEAAEQCGRLDVPAIAETVSLAELLARPGPVVWGDPAGPPAARALAAPALAAAPGGPTLLVGPEGGFEAHELRALAAREGARPASLGPLALRAETAAIALLAVWAAVAGPDVLRWRDATDAREAGDAHRNLSQPAP